MYCFSTLAEFIVLRDSIKEDLVRTLDTDASGLFIAVNEAVNNAIFHGNGNDAGKKVYLTVASLPNEVKIMIRDEGAGYSPPKSGADDDPLCEHGRGLQIIQHWVDFHHFNPQRNEITLIKKRKAEFVR